MPEKYKQWDTRFRNLSKGYDEDWSDKEKRNHYGNMKEANGQYVCHSNVSRGILVRSVLLS